MPEQKTDLRVTKTRGAIQTAFQQMICEMDASEITIKELAQRACIHRKTFYLHYSSIEALYEELMQQIVGRYCLEIDQIPIDAPFTEVNRVFFQFVTAQPPYVERILCVESYFPFAEQLFAASNRHNRQRYNPYINYPAEEQHIIDSFLVRTSVTLYRQWVADGKTLPQERLIALSGTLLMNGISSIPQV